MITKTITYTDYNGDERTEKFLFNLTKAEILEMELGTTGGFTDMIQKIVEARDTPSILKVFKGLILSAYGEKSADGRHFNKKDENGRRLSEAFSQTEAFSSLFMELVSDSESAAQFVNGLVATATGRKAESNAVSSTVAIN